jgi:hypothetical protein
MRNFVEFMREQLSRDDIKTMVLDALEGNPESETVENSPLQDYEKVSQILTYPELNHIISEHPKRGSIIEMIQRAKSDPNITVGMVINAISST